MTFFYNGSIYNSNDTAEFIRRWNNFSENWPTYFTSSSEQLAYKTSRPIIQELSNLFNSKQDPELLSVHAEFKYLESKIVATDTEITRMMQDAIHVSGFQSAERLCDELAKLNSRVNEQRKGLLLQVIHKVLNVFKWILNLPMIEYKHLEYVDIGLIRKRLIEPALELTNEERKSLATTPSINRCSTGEQLISKETILKIKNGLRGGAFFFIKDEIFKISSASLPSERGLLLSYHGQTIARVSENYCDLNIEVLISRAGMPRQQIYFSCNLHQYFENESLPDRYIILEKDCSYTILLENKDSVSISI